MINTANLQKRLLFVFIAVPIAWFIVNSQFSVTPSSLPPVYPGQILSIILVLMGTYEYTKMLSIIYPHNAFWLSYIWILGLSVAHLLNFNIPDMLSVFVLLILVAIESFFWGKRNRQKRWVRASLLFSGTIFLNIASISLLSLYKEPFQLLFFTPDNPFLSQLGIVTVLTSIFLCDSAAYLAGSAWGRHHFSTISPNKTIEGSIAGLIAATVVSSIGWVFLRNPEYPVILGPILGLLIGVMAQVGDLLESIIKRNFKVKDSSTLIPGHGGILDRFDSVFFTAPVLYLFAWLVTK
ncbi:MAG: phosphatidate cytidylyltransferase [Chitinispirillaceae bacterium]